MEGNFMVKESQWQLHAWLRKKGYRMPAGEEKYKLPTPQENKEFDTYEKKILDKAKGLGEKAEEETINSPSFSRPAEPMPTEKDWGEFHKYKDTISKKLSESKKAEEVAVEALPNSPKENMEIKYKPKEGKPTYIDTVPSGKGKSLQEWASNMIDAFLAEEKVKTSEMKKMIQDHLRSPESLLDDWKPGAKIPKIKQAPFASSDDDEEEVQKGPAGPIDVSKGAPPGFIPRSHKKAEEERRLSPIRRSMKGVPHEKDVTRHLQVIDPVKKKAEEGVVDTIKKFLDPAPKAPKENIRIPLTKTSVRRQMQKAEEEKVDVSDSKYKKILKSDPKMSSPKVGGPRKMIDRVSYQKAEEDKPADRDYTEWNRQQHDKQSKPMIKRISEKLFGEEEIRGITNTSPTLLDVKKDTPEKELHPTIKHFWDKSEPKKADETSDYIKGLEKRKPLPGAPVYPKKKVVPMQEAPLTAAQYVQKAEVELDEPKKAFDEDGLNELYMFMDWMHSKGLKADDGDKLEELMDQYEIKKFAEEAMPPAEFSAPGKIGEKK